MQRKHVAFVIESSHGHLNPTLGIAAELIRRGHRVSYAVKERFAARVAANGAQAVVYRPLDIKYQIFKQIRDDSGQYQFDAAGRRRFTESLTVEAENTLPQLESLYAQDRPDLILFDFMNSAGERLAGKWSIPAIEHSPIMIDMTKEYWHRSRTVIVSIPEFFQRNVEHCASHFHFVSPGLKSRKTEMQPWVQAASAEPIVLVSATTGLLPEVGPFQRAMRAFEHLPWNVVLSIGTDIEAAALGALPANFSINQFSSQLDVLPHSRLFVGEGGQGSILEALYCGVPLLMVSASSVHDDVASRVAELGVGLHLREGEASAANLREAAGLVMRDSAILERVQQFKKIMRDNDDIERLGALIEQHMGSGGQ